MLEQLRDRWHEWRTRGDWVDRGPWDWTMMQVNLWPLVKVISGGQTGADQGGLVAAKDLGYTTGGWAPLGWRTEDGPAPWLADYGLQETPMVDYPFRTALNVSDSDATLLFGSAEEPGSALTIRTCRRLRKPWAHVESGAGGTSPRMIHQWILQEQIKVLNVAGNRQSKRPGFDVAVAAFLRLALVREMPEGTDEHSDET